MSAWITPLIAAILGAGGFGSLMGFFQIKNSRREGKLKNDDQLIARLYKEIERQEARAIKLSRLLQKRWENQERLLDYGASLRRDLIELGRVPPPTPELDDE